MSRQVTRVVFTKKIETAVLENEIKPSLNKQEEGQTVERNKLDISRNVPRQASSLQNDKKNDKTNKNHVHTYADVVLAGRKV